jgi:hypothetical protein
VIIRLIQAHRYNSAVIDHTKKLIRKHFRKSQFFIERSSTDYLKYTDSIRYTDFFRKKGCPVELAAIHYFDFSIEQFKRVLDMSHQDDVAELVSEMEHGLDQMLLAHLRTASTDNGKIGAALSVFISDLDRQASGETEAVSYSDSGVRPVGEY